MPVASPRPRVSDSLLAALVNSSTDAILSKDLSGTITSWNPGAEQLFGYTADEVIGQPVTLLFPRDRLDEETVILERIRGGERVEHFETVRLRKDGTAIDVSLTISPIRDARGAIVGASKVARDITAQRRERERVRVTLDSIGDAVVSTDEEGLVVVMNEAAARATGWSIDSARGRPLAEVVRLVREGDRQEAVIPFSRVLRTGSRLELGGQVLLAARDGSERPIDGTASPIGGPDGRTTGLVLVFRDSSQRRATALAQSRLAAIIEGSEDAIVGENLRGEVTSWNPAAERMFGYPAAEMIGQPVARLLPPDRQEEERQIFARVQRGERVDHYSSIRVRRDGSPIHISLSISAVRDTAGNLVGVSKIVRDISAIRDAQKQLQAHTRDLEIKVRERTASLQATIAELEAFSYSLSHDMRAPLRAIQSFTELVLQDHCGQNREAGEYLRRVVSAANRMDRLIQEVLNFTRLSRQEIEVSPIDVDRLVRDIIHERPEFQAAQIRVRRPLLPVLGHEASLTQCLTNLLSNAVKFVPPGRTPDVEVFTTQHGERVRISVRDQGIGISTASQQKLFAIFQRLSSNPDFEGTGVGLAIVRKAAERMGGSVGVESKEGEGSLFWVELTAAP